MNVTRAEGLSLLKEIVLERGTMGDYRELAHLHYVPGDPAVVAGVWRAVYRADLRFSICNLRLKNRRALRVAFNRKSKIESRKSDDRLIAVGVLAYPTPCCLARERELGISGPRYGGKLRFINEHVRTIARVIVHPQFRGMGVASGLVRRICEDCTTRYVDAMAVMGEVVPVFEKAGMRRCEKVRESEGAYFLWERGRDDRVTR